MLLAVTAASLFLGYAQWRRQRILREIQALAAEGAHVPIKSEWIDRIWLRTGDHAFINFVEVSPTHRQLGSRVYEYAKGEGSEHYESLERRCLELGVKDVFPARTTSEKLKEMTESKRE